MNVKCNKCGYTADEKEFPTGNDFFQNTYIRGCPNCDNSQNPGDASMRMFGGERPFVYVQQEEKIDDVVLEVLKRSEEAS